MSLTIKKLLSAGGVLYVSSIPMGAGMFSLDHIISGYRPWLACVQKETL